MLRAFRLLLRPGGATGFYTIHTSPGLDERLRQRAHRSGPWAVAAAHQPGELLRRAGYVDVAEFDVTDEFRTTARLWIEQWDTHRDALIELHGEADFASRQALRRTELQAIEEGLLCRSLVVGRRPG